MTFGHHGRFLETAIGRLDLVHENLHGVFPNASLFSLLLLSLVKKDKPYPRTTKKIKDEYDFIVVGGGSAGSVVANRLSEVSDFDVLLIEAGAGAPVLSEIPAIPRTLYQSRVDWAYETVPQKNCAKSHIGRRVTWNSGKALGGSSVLNSAFYIRGNRRNYDQWSKEGAEGWSFDEVLPYFLKLEDNRNIDELDAGYHGTGGPLTIERPTFTSSFKKPVISALVELGYKLTDINGKRQTGIFDLQGILRNGQRCSAAKAYLVPAEKRPNLHIVKNAFAKRIMIKEKIAFGVEFDFGGVSFKVRARNEVIISAGTVIRSPQLLMNSGIGPARHLGRFGIDVVSDLPVGENLQDHYSTSIPFLLTSRKTSHHERYFDSLNIKKYLKHRKGPLAAPNQCAVIGFLNGIKGDSNGEDFPLQQVQFSDFNVLDLKKNYNLRPEVYKKFFRHYEGQSLYSCLVSLLQPKSRGRITLRSTDPYDYPLIDPKYYDDKDDLENIVTGLKICHRVATSKHLKKIGSRPLDRVIPGCERFAGDLDQLFRCHAKSFILGFKNPVGTCRMGRRNDPRSVVDPELRVIGVNRLRVVSSAVMPIIPSGQTNIATIMLAEKACDLIRSDRGYYSRDSDSRDLDTSDSDSRGSYSKDSNSRDSYSRDSDSRDSDSKDLDTSDSDSRGSYSKDSKSKDSKSKDSNSKDSYSRNSNSRGSYSSDTDSSDTDSSYTDSSDSDSSDSNSSDSDSYYYEYSYEY